MKMQAFFKVFDKNVLWLTIGLLSVDVLIRWYVRPFGECETFPDCGSVPSVRNHVEFTSYTLLVVYAIMFMGVYDFNKGRKRTLFVLFNLSGLINLLEMVQYKYVTDYMYFPLAYTNIADLLVVLIGWRMVHGAFYGYTTEEES